MIARHLVPGLQRSAGLERLERFLGERAADTLVDFPSMADRRSRLAESLSALGLFFGLTTVLTAGSVIGRGYAYSDVIVLLAVQLATAFAIWRIRWSRVPEAWLLAAIGSQALFVASLITLTGEAGSPYFALYAPVLALAGWHLRPGHAAIAVAFVAGMELWRALVVEAGASLDHLSVALPAFALLALLARLTSQRLTAAVVLNRRDQVRTAATLRVMRRIGDRGPDQPLDLAGALGEVFAASATMAAFEGDPDDRGCLQPNDFHGHLAVQVGASGATFARIRLCRREAFSASERRLAAILGDAMGHQLEHRRLFEEVRLEAQRDHLTGVLNRSAFDRDLQVAVGATAADSSSLSLYLLQIKGFAQLSERYGQGRADSVLQRVALMLLAQAGVADRVYRFADDEFAVLAPDAAPQAAAERGALLRRVAGRALYHGAEDGGPSPASLSIGIASCRAADCSADGLVAAARAALESQPSAPADPE